MCGVFVRRNNKDGKDGIIIPPGKFLNWSKLSDSRATATFLSSSQHVVMFHVCPMIGGKSGS